MSNPNWVDMEAETGRISALMSTENERDKAQNSSASEVEDDRISTSMSIHHILNVDQNGQIPGTPSNAEDAEPHKRLCLQPFLSKCTTTLGALIRSHAKTSSIPFAKTHDMTRSPAACRYLPQTIGTS